MTIRSLVQLIFVLAVGMAVLSRAETPSAMTSWSLAVMAMILGVIAMDHFDLAAAARGRIGGLHVLVGIYALWLSVSTAFPAMILAGDSADLFEATFKDDVYGGPPGTFHHHVVTAVTCLLAMVNRSARQPKFDRLGRRRDPFATSSTIIVVSIACLGMGWLAIPGLQWLVSPLAEVQNGILMPVGGDDIRRGFVRDGALPGRWIYLLTPGVLMVGIAGGMRRRGWGKRWGAAVVGTVIVSTVVISTFYAATLPTHVPVLRGVMQVPPLRSLMCLVTTLGVIAIVLVGGRGWGLAEGRASLMAANPVGVAVGVGLLAAGILEIRRTSELHAWWTHDDPFPKILSFAMVGLGCHWIWSLRARSGLVTPDDMSDDRVALLDVVGVWVLLVLLVLSLAPFGTAVNDLLTAAG